MTENSSLSVHTAPPTSPVEPRGGRLECIDVLRGMAALAVVAIHIPHEAPGGFREHPFSLLAWLINFGYLGVPLFVLISGFCIHRRAALSLASTGQMTVSWRAFWVRRFFRLYPPYVAAMTISVLTALFITRMPPDLWEQLPADLAWHLAMIHNLSARYCAGLGNGAFWSLGMEEQLYGLYAILLLLFSRYSRSTAVLVVLATTLVWRISIPFLGGEPKIGLGPLGLGAWQMWPFAYWLHWTLGAVAVDIACGNITIPKIWHRLWTFWALFGMGVLLNDNSIRLIVRIRQFQLLIGDYRQSVDTPAFLAIHYVGEIFFAGAFFVLLNWSITNEQARWFHSWLARQLASVGRVSYSVYLMHIPVIYLLRSFEVFPESDPKSWALRYLCFGGCSLIAGYAFYFAVEQWFLKPTVWETRTRPKTVSPG